MLGREGRLGNQLFQYAFLRLTAERLGVSFYCPAWIGDEIFDLRDKDQRAEEPLSITSEYRQVWESPGFVKESLEVADGTNIRGYFQSARHYPDPDLVRSWFRWRPDVVEPVHKRYRDLDFSKALGMHLRFGDFFRPHQYLSYYSPSSQYYRTALETVSSAEQVLVFSDEPAKAKSWLKWSLKGSLREVSFVQGNEGWEDLYLMTQCRHMVCSASTLCWWGAWLNPGAGSTVIAPQEGPFHPAHSLKNPDFWPEDWILQAAMNYSLRDRLLTEMYRLAWRLWRNR